jgi:hypothetical protein
MPCPSRKPRVPGRTTRGVKKNCRRVVEVPDVRATLHRRDEGRADERTVQSQVRDRAEDDGARLNAAPNLVVSLAKTRKARGGGEDAARGACSAEAGAEQPGTLTTADNLAHVLPLGTRRACGGGGEDSARGTCSAKASARGGASRHLHSRGLSGSISLAWVCVGVLLRVCQGQHAEAE